LPGLQRINYQLQTEYTFAVKFTSFGQDKSGCGELFEYQAFALWHQATWGFEKDGID
jgi:hypothetical protein